MENSVLQIRVDSELKEKAAKLYKDLGIDLSTAIRLFFNKSLSVSNIPFDIANTNERRVDNKAKKKYTISDFKKYMCTNETSYKGISVEDYIKELRSDRY